MQREPTTMKNASDASGRKLPPGRRANTSKHPCTKLRCSGGSLRWGGGRGGGLGGALGGHSDNSTHKHKATRCMILGLFRWVCALHTLAPTAWMRFWGRVEKSQEKEGPPPSAWNVRILRAPSLYFGGAGKIIFAFESQPRRLKRQAFLFSSSGNSSWPQYCNFGSFQGDWLQRFQAQDFSS